MRIEAYIDQETKNIDFKNRKDAQNFNEQPIKKYDLDIGSFYFYDNLVISEIKSGVTFDIENSSELYRLIENHFGNDTVFFYIANRKNSYSFNPTGHFNFIKHFPNAKAFAVVVYDETNRQIAEYEKSFVQAPTGIFKSLEEAITWGKETILLD